MHFHFTLIAILAQYAGFWSQSGSAMCFKDLFNLVTSIAFYGLVSFSTSGFL